jgi:carboxypeptidase Q
MESDNGVFKPFGIAYSGSQQGLTFARELAHLLRSIGADSAQASGPEADVWPLNTLGVPTIAINTDPTRYFWYHHTEADTIDKLDPREIGLCVSVMAVVANTVANMNGIVPRAPIPPPGG